MKINKTTITILLLLIMKDFAGYGQIKTPAALIDMHFHAYDLKTIKDSVDSYFKLNSTYSIKKLGVITIAERKDTLQVMKNNDILINYAAIDHRIFPICSVNPHDMPFALHELDRLGSKGVKIIKMHPVTQSFNVADSSVYKIVKNAGKLGMVILFDGYNDMDANQIGKFILLAWRCPDTKIIVAHTGMYDFIKLNEITSFKAYPEYKKNIYVDIAEVAPLLLNSPYKDQFIWTLKNIGLDHVLFGSGTPSGTVKETVNALQKTGFTTAELKQIYYGNTATLLGLTN